MTNTSNSPRPETINKAAAYLDLEVDIIGPIAGIYNTEIRQALYHTLMDRKQSKRINYAWAAINSSNEEKKMESNSTIRSIALSMNLATSLIPVVLGKSSFIGQVKSTKSIDHSKSSALFKLIFTDCLEQFMTERADLELNSSSMLRVAIYLLFSVLSLLLLAYMFA